VATWIVVWFILGSAAVLVLAAFLIALTRHALVVGRAARRMADEVGPIADEISREGGRATERMAHLQPPRPSGRTHGPG
jgi:hypothetical protein